MNRTITTILKTGLKTGLTTGLVAGAAVLILGGAAYANPARDTVPGAITEPHILWLGQKGFPEDGATLPKHMTQQSPSQNAKSQDEPEHTTG